jgi:hypothetical protein
MKPATPLPWKANTSGPAGRRALYIYGGENYCIAGLGDRVDAQKANAAYIVHASNTYPKLVEALREVLAAHDNEMAHGGQVYTEGEAIRALLTEAEKGQSN